LQLVSSGSNQNVGGYWEWTGTWATLLGIGATEQVEEVTSPSFVHRCAVFTNGNTSRNWVGALTLHDSGGALLATLVAATSAYTGTTSWATASGSTYTLSSPQAASTTIRLRFTMNAGTTSGGGTRTTTVRGDAVALSVTHNAAPQVLAPNHIAAATTVHNPTAAAATPQSVTPDHIAAASSVHNPTIEHTVNWPFEAYPSAQTWPASDRYPSWEASAVAQTLTPDLARLMVDADRELLKS
jgi:hypothetical protein